MGNFLDAPLNVGSEKQVFIDWNVVEPGYGVGWGPRNTLSELPYEIPSGIQLKVHAPRIDPRPLIFPEHPWEKYISAYIIIFEDGGRFRMFYECYADPNGTSNYAALLAYAESSDGETWTKPKLGVEVLGGSKENNLVFGDTASLGRGAHGASVIKDVSAPPSERYKLVYIGSDETKSYQKGRYVFGAVSPDGIRWTSIKEPLIGDYESDTQNVLSYDAKTRRYRLYLRSWKGMHMGKWHGRRCIAYSESEDFRSFPTPQIIVAPDATTEPDVDIYTNSYHLWPGTSDAHLLFPAHFHRTDDVHDLHLMVSRDGKQWLRPSRDPIIPIGEPGSAGEAGYYAGVGIVPFKKGEWTLPVAPQINVHGRGIHVPVFGPMPPQKSNFQRAIWREDGFMSIEASAEGKFTTVPMNYTGKELRISAWTRFGGEVRVELVDSTNQEHWMKKVHLPEVVTGYSMQECAPMTGDILNQTVAWGVKSDVSFGAGRAMRLRFYLRRARLHSFQFI